MDKRPRGLKERGNSGVRICLEQITDQCNILESQYTFTNYFFPSLTLPFLSAPIFTPNFSNSMILVLQNNVWEAESRGIIMYLLSASELKERTLRANCFRRVFMVGTFLGVCISILLLHLFKWYFLISQDLCSFLIAGKLTFCKMLRRNIQKKFYTFFLSFWEKLEFSLGLTSLSLSIIILCQKYLYCVKIWQYFYQKNFSTSKSSTFEVQSLD